MASTSNKDYNPLLQLNNKMTVLLVLSVFFLFIFVNELVSRHKNAHHIFDYYWILTSLGLVGYCLFNLKIIKRLRRTTVPLKKNIEKDVSMLERSLKKMDLLNDIFLIISVLILETLILLHRLGHYVWHSYSLDDWSSVPFFVRAVLYLAFSFLIYYRRRHPLRMDFRQDIICLRELVDKM